MYIKYGMLCVKIIWRLVDESTVQDVGHSNWNFGSLELLFPRTFVLNIKISMELLFSNIDY